MQVCVQKQNQSQRSVSSDLLRSKTAAPGSNHHAHPILPLRRTIGNQAAQRLLQNNADELEVGSANTTSPRCAHDFSRIPVYAPGKIQTGLPAVSGGSSFAVTDHPQQIAREKEPTEQVRIGGPAPEQSPADQLQNEPERPHACVVTAQIPSYISSMALFDNVVAWKTIVDIEWRPPQGEREPMHKMAYCNCACGEYRQYVKGHIIRNGRRFDIGLCGGAKLQEDTYQEDGDAKMGVCYGHRDRKESPNDIFDSPNRESGCHYEGKDEPHLRGKPGDMVDFDLKFKGQTYDNCLDKFGQIHEWPFTYKGPLLGP